MADTLICTHRAGEILTQEFEELYEASELGEELVADCDDDTLEEFAAVRKTMLNFHRRQLSPLSLRVMHRACPPW